MSLELNQHQFRPGKILVVDDEKKNRKILRIILEAEGHTIFEAVDGEEALRMVGEQPPDVILLDVIMPKLDGFEVCQRLKAAPETSHIPILIITALTGRKNLLQGIKAGADDFLNKPIDVEETILRVRNSVHSKQLYEEVCSCRNDLEQKVALQTKEIRLAHSKLQQQVKELEARDRLVRFQMKAPPLEETYAEIIEVIVDVLEVKQVIMYRPDLDHKILQATYSYGISQAGRLTDTNHSTHVPDLAIDTDDALTALAYQQCCMQQNNSDEIAAPIIYNDEVLGVVWVNGLPKEKSRDESMGILSRLAREAAMVIRSAKLAEDLCSGQVSVAALLNLNK